MEERILIALIEQVFSYPFVGIEENEQKYVTTRMKIELLKLIWRDPKLKEIREDHDNLSNLKFIKLTTIINKSGNLQFECYYKPEKNVLYRYSVYLEFKPNGEIHELDIHRNIHRI